MTAMEEHYAYPWLTYINWSSILFAEVQSLLCVI